MFHNFSITIIVFAKQQFESLPEMYKKKQRRGKRISSQNIFTLQETLSYQCQADIRNPLCYLLITRFAASAA